MNSNEQNGGQTPTRDEEIEQMAREFPFRKNRRRFFWKVPLILALLAAKVGVVMVLWNYLMPDLFHLPTLDYLQTLGLMALVKLLFGFGFHRFGGGWGGGFGGKFGGGGRGFRKMHDRWHSMSREEKDKLREALRKRWEA